MSREELDIAIGWAAQEGWNPGLYDAEVFWQTDPDGFIALEKDGELIGSGSIVSYCGKFGFMGFFMIKPEYRNKGLGTELWYYRRDTLLKRLKEGATIGMDGVFDMQGFYEKGGFVFSHRDLRMVRVAESYDYSNNIQEIRPEDFEHIYALDKECFGYDRKNFASKWLTMPDSKAFKYVTNSDIMGYGVIRKCMDGYKIGPLFSSNYNVAEELFRGLSNYANGNKTFLDVPEINNDAIRLAQKYNMQEVFGCARMYYAGKLDLPYDKIFGVTTFELG